MPQHQNRRVRLVFAVATGRVWARSKILIVKAKKAGKRIQSHSLEDDNDDGLQRGNGKGS
jgi:hypothetical protein